MKEENVKKAIKYANATSKIEDIKMTKEELNDLRSAIIDEKNDKDFLNNVVSKLNKKGNLENVKNRK